MKKITIAFVVAASLLFSGIVGARGSEIGWLAKNHDKFTADFVENGYRTLEWDIYAPYAAIERLESHLRFMKSRLERGRVVRSWDKFFVLDAAVFHYYDMEITRTGEEALKIEKWATNDCAYQVIRTHAYVVKTEFFELGDLSNDHSAIADVIIASPECDDYRDEIEYFIDQYWTPK